MANITNLGLLFLWVSLARTCQSYFLFQGINFSSVDSLYCFLSPSFDFFPYFFPSTELACSCIFKILRWVTTSFNVSIILIQALITINIALRTTFAVSQRFWWVLLSFYLFGDFFFNLSPDFFNGPSIPQGCIGQAPYICIAPVVFLTIHL